MEPNARPPHGTGTGSPDTTSIRGSMSLSHADLESFAEASGDRNPLHMSAEYARRTPFGRRVVHGVLAAMAALDQVPATPGTVDGVDLEFRQPLHLDVRYGVAISHPVPGRTLLTVLDGDVTCATVTLSYGPASDVAHLPRSLRREPRVVTTDELVPGFAVTGSYGPGAGLDVLCRRWPNAARLLGRLPLTCLLWCSFVTGMELPGSDCLLGGVSLRLRPVGPAGPLDLRYRAEVTGFDSRFGLLTGTASLGDGTAVVADATLETMVRRPVPGVSADRLTGLLPRSDRLRGHTSVVVGGSRGLGAALALALASQGGRVLVGHRSTPGGPAQPAVPGHLTAPAAHGDLAELAALGAGLGGELVSCPGDAATGDWSRRAAEAARGSLDLLVCCAAPPIRPLRLDPAGLGRVQDFVTGAFALVSTPMAGLLGAVDRARGRCLVVSSSAVTAPPVDWPHYVAAKYAVEGLVHWAAAWHPDTEFFVTRPGMLLTEQMNTPGARERAAAVEPVAATLVRRLADPAPATDRPEFVAV
ncbi:MaoC/PaaZ C-terminal domain-containing protein [Streptosporangium saharense]|uniref:MaoC/PaaZ C-terminal domain-containing protein n=1 Tax=Streptosporangium saharense TaxID=1706840 RepID=UPI0036A92175